MKTPNALKKIKNLIEELKSDLSKIEEKKEAKENIFEDRTENWQESEKGEAFREEIQELEDLHLEFETFIGDLESDLDDIIEKFEEHGQNK